MTDWFTDDYRFVRKTYEAICVEDADGKEHWLPKSQIVWDEADVDPSQGDMIQVSMPEWLATEKGLC